MARTQAIYYRDDHGSEPVDEFLNRLSKPAAQAAIDLQIDRLNGLHPADPPLPFPHSSQIDGALRELRCHYGSDLYRIFYRRSGNLFVLLHGFAKKSQKVPRAEVAIAQARWADFQARMAAAPRRPPRAVGRDAP